MLFRSDRRLEASKAGDWEALEALCAPTLVVDDRRRGMRNTGGRDLLIANDRYVFSRGAQLTHRVLATYGDRLALQHHTWREADGAAPFEIETLGLVEVDAGGRIVAIMSFDPDDRCAASTELVERYARTDAARMPVSAIEVLRALNDHDLHRARAALPDDYVFHDHRRTGLGRLASADEYIASVAAMLELTPDGRTEDLYQIAAEKHGRLSVARTFGTNTEGGEFESLYVRLSLYRGDRLAETELFELEDLDAARARFEELAEP